MQKKLEDTYWQNRQKLTVYLRWLEQREASIREDSQQRTSLQNVAGWIPRILIGGLSQKRPGRG